MTRSQIRPKLSVTFVEPEEGQRVLLDAFFFIVLADDCADHPQIASHTERFFGKLVELRLPEHPGGTCRWKTPDRGTVWRPL